MPSLPFIFLFLLMGLSPASAQGGHLGTPQEQHACSRDAIPFLPKTIRR